MGASFDIRPVEPSEAEAFWQSRQAQGPLVSPRLDLNLRGLQTMDELTIDDVGRVGAKAAQMARLSRIGSRPDVADTCADGLLTPDSPAAIPVIHGIEHLEESGALDLLRSYENSPEFRNDPIERAAGLRAVRSQVENHPVNPDLLEEVESYIRTHYGDQRVRFRSSSNTEDLSGFNGAGLYTSVSGQLDSEKRAIDDAIRTVWASLYLQRAYDERRYHHIDETQVAMGILIHPAFLSEKANGVAISRNILQPIRDQDYINVQIGEASVANPAPGVTTEHTPCWPEVA
jgi:phosphoenolpyruvate synthase/pyruvate phosphate dikinase